ncbi:MAG TPA: hypothetical protein VGK74_16755 [Symbiobacteriaceae bacterium]
MEQTISREQGVADLHSTSDEARVAAAKGLLQLGEFGTPAGTHLLAGAKAALRLWRLADAVVLTYHGLKVVQPQTMLWADMLANRAIACARHGFYSEAISAGEQFLKAVEALPAAAQWLPYVHHAMGLAHDCLQQYADAAFHHRLATELHVDPVERAIAASDLAYSLARSGNAAEADRVLSQVADVGNPFASFVVACTTTLVRYHQRRHAEAVTAGKAATALAAGQEDAWAVPVAELHYWMSKAVWELGDGFHAAAWALHAAVVAEERFQLALSKAATEWLAEIMDRGGIRDA